MDISKSDIRKLFVFFREEFRKLHNKYDELNGLVNLNEQPNNEETIRRNKKSNTLLYSKPKKIKNKRVNKNYRYIAKYNKSKKNVILKIPLENFVKRKGVQMKRRNCDVDHVTFGTNMWLILIRFSSKQFIPNYKYYRKKSDLRHTRILFWLDSGLSLDFGLCVIVTY